MSQISPYESGLESSVGQYTFSSDLQIAVINRSAGAFYLAKGGSYTDWTLLWVSDMDTTDPLTPAATVTDAPLEMDAFQVSALPTPWDADLGIATDHLDGARSASDTFTHEPDCIICFTVTTLNTAGVMAVDFRMVDTSNLWRLSIYYTGKFDLSKIVDGVTTYLFYGDGPVTDGSAVKIAAFGTTINIYLDGLLYISCDTATDFQTATDGILSGLGTGGSVSDIVCWPRVLSGDALDVLGEMETYDSEETPTPTITGTPPTPTNTPTQTTTPSSPTITPTVTPTPPPTATPSYLQAVPLSTGNNLLVEKKISFGDIGVITAILLVALIQLLKAMVTIPARFFKR